MSLTKNERKESMLRMLGKMFDEELQLNKEESELIKRLNEIQQRREQIIEERKVLQEVADSNGFEYVGVSHDNMKIRYSEDDTIKSVATKTKKADNQKIQKNKRITKSQKHEIEATIRDIMNEKGTPIKLAELIEKLADRGYKWNTYQSAFGYISKLDFIEKVSRSYYQLIK